MRLGFNVIIATSLASVSFGCQPQSNSDSAAPVPQPEVIKETFDIRLEVDPAFSPSPEIVGFDQVLAILRNPGSGPCTRCHATQWPYLSDKGWPDFVRSLDHPKIKDKAAATLGGMIANCVDMEAKDGCTGDPDDPTDNIDFKMPSKFGDKPLPPEDVALIRSWVAGGANEFSAPAKSMLRLSESHHFRIDEGGSSPIMGPVLTTQTGTGMTLELARSTDECVPKDLIVQVFNVADERLGSGPLRLACQDETMLAPAAVLIK